MKKITNRVLWLFAVGQLGWSILSGIVTNWLVFFYQPNAQAIANGQTIFIKQGPILLGLTVIGLIAAVGRLFDAFTDPLIASKSDCCKHKDGRRIPFMRSVAIPFGIVTVLIFISPINGQSPINSYFLLLMSMAFYLCMTIYCTPYNALIPELGKSQNDRINLSTFISVTFFIGTAIAYLVPNIAGLFEQSFGYVNALRITIGILALVATICMLIPSLFIKEKDYVVSTPCDTPALGSLMKTFKNKQFQIFVGSDVFYWIALTIFQTGLPFYITSLMKLEAGMSFVLFALMTVMSLVFYGPVNILAKKLGKKSLVLFAYFFFVFVFVITSLSGTFGISGLYWGLIVSILASIPMAVLGILPQAIVADIAEADAKVTNENREGMFFAARTFSFKLGQSLAMLIFTSLARVGVENFGYRLTAIVAATLCLIGGLVMIKYNEKLIFKQINGDK